MQYEQRPSSDSVASEPTKHTDASSAAGLMWTRAAVIALIAIVTWVTVSYCSQVYFDREAAFHGALECSVRVLRQHQVDFWLQNGTLLGSTRLGRLVLWDADLDIGFLRGKDDDDVLAALDHTCFGRAAHVHGGKTHAALRVWRKCTHRLCAEFHETIREGDRLRSGDGVSPVEELLPLKSCVVANVEANCPNNAPYYLAQAYGQDWLTRPLTKLF